MTFYEFTDRLATQMLEYDPSQRRYPGDSRMRKATQMAKRRRQSGETETQDVNGLLVPTFAKTTAQARLVGPLDQLCAHLGKVVTALKHPRNCKACNLPCYSACEHPSCMDKGKGPRSTTSPPRAQGKAGCASQSTMILHTLA